MVGHAAVPDVVIIGAGAVGAAVALELADRGVSVSVLERGAGPAAGCSWGNAGVVGAGHVSALASPAMMREGACRLLERHGPLGIAPGPGVSSWLLRYVRAATRRRAERADGILRELALESASLHRGLSERLGLELYEQGLLEVYENDRAFASARRRAQRAAHRPRILGAPEVAAACGHLAVPTAGGLFEPDDAHCDPGRLVTATVEAACSKGASLRTGVEVLDVRRQGDRVTDLITSVGSMPVREVVIAAGAWTPDIARELPVNLPVQGGKGYHIEVPRENGDTDVPIIFAEHRVVVTPLDQRLRISGMLQVAGTDMRVDTARVDAILGHARRLLRGLADRPVLRIWRGLRPCTPDGLPIVGRVPGASNVTLATGHGMWGLQLAPITGQLVADIIADRGDAERLHPLRPQRFGRLGIDRS